MAHERLGEAPQPERHHRHEQGEQRLECPRDVEAYERGEHTGCDGTASWIPRLAVVVDKTELVTRGRQGGEVTAVLEQRVRTDHVDGGVAQNRVPRKRGGPRQHYRCSENGDYAPHRHQQCRVGVLRADSAVPEGKAGYGEPDRKRHSDLG
jgi:hypothetical protein